MKYVAAFCLLALSCFAADYPTPKEGDFATKNFKFRDGESLPELRLHYMTIGTPRRDARGQVTNAVLILHGTGGSGKQFLQPQFANELFGPGQPLDATRYYIILPDNVGHGGSSKPSNGLRMRFPKYDYDDMVAAQHLLVTEGLGVQHLRLIFGTSMGCMHAFVWGETYPDFMDALMPMACQTAPIAGRNRMWRKAVIDSIELDPAWNNGEYKEQPVNGLRSAVYILAIAGSAPLNWQKQYPTRDDANKFVENTVEPRVKSLDANDMIYQFDASRNYNPSPNLEKIRAPLMWINTTDDFINPPEMATPEREVKRIPRGRFHLIQATEETRGHSTHTWAVFWKQYLLQLLQESEPLLSQSPSDSPLQLQSSKSCDPDWSPKFDQIYLATVTPRIYWKALGSKKALIDDYVRKTGGLQNLISAMQSSKETDEALLKQNPNHEFLKNSLLFDEGMLEVALCRAAEK